MVPDLKSSNPVEDSCKTGLILLAMCEALEVEMLATWNETRGAQRDIQCLREAEQESGLDLPDGVPAFITGRK